MVFAEKDFPLLASEPPPKFVMAQNIPSSKPPPSTTMAPQAVAYNYHAELDRITANIENHLKPKFDTLFAQLDIKINNLAEQQMKQYAGQTRQYAEQTKQYEEQQAVNTQNAQQLAWVVDNMKKFFQYTHPNLPFTSKSLQSDGRGSIMNLIRDIPETHNATPTQPPSPAQHHNDSQHSHQSQATHTHMLPPLLPRPPPISHIKHHPQPTP